MKDLDDNVNLQVKVRSKVLEDQMGICGIQNYQEGALWERVKIKAMEKDAPDDCIIVSQAFNLLINLDRL